MSFKVAIVGQGFVGSAIFNGLKDYHQVETFDLDTSKSTKASLAELVEFGEIIFVCLPTPMRKNGECDTRILENVIEDIDSLCANKTSQKKTIVIKSTVIPGTTKSLDEKYKNINISFSPEFLPEANSFEDFKKQSSIIVG